MRRILFFLMLCATVLASNAQEGAKIEGRWLIPDDYTGKPKCYIDVYTHTDGFIYAKVAEILLDLPDKANIRCTECKGEKKNMPILGMNIVERMRLGSKGRYEGGTILDTDYGKVYNCKMWLDPADSNVLLVRGYWGPLYRTLRLTRVSKQD